MTVAQLIAALQKLPQDSIAGYVNTCADNGLEFMGIDRVELKPRTDYQFTPAGMPVAAVVLS